MSEIRFPISSNFNLDDIRILGRRIGGGHYGNDTVHVAEYGVFGGNRQAKDNHGNSITPQKNGGYTYHCTNGAQLTLEEAAAAYRKLTQEGKVISNPFFEFWTGESYRFRGANPIGKACKAGR